MSLPNEIELASSHDERAARALGAHRPAADAAMEPAQSGPSIVSSLLERWKTVVLVSLSVGAASLLVIWCFVGAKYEVSATVHVAPVVRPVLFTDQDTDISRNYRQYVGTEAANITSPALIDAALDTPEVRVLSIVANSADPIEDLLSRLTVGLIPATELLRVSMVGDNPQEMVTIVNNLIQTYLRRRHEQQYDWDERILGSLRKEESELEAKLEIKGRQLQQVAVEKGLSGAEPSNSMMETWIAELQQLMTQAKKELALTKGRLDALDSPDGSIVNPADFEIFLANDPEFKSLKDQLGAAENAALSDGRMGRGPSHPEVLGRAAVIEGLKERSKAREAQLTESYKTVLRRRLESDRRDAEVTVRVLDDELRRLTSDRSQVAGDLFVLENLRHERERLELSLNQVREKIWNVEVEQNRVPRITSDSPAQVPAAPNKDKRLKFSAVAVMMSLFAGVGVAMLRARLDTRLHHPVEVVERLGVRVLGSVQFVADQGVVQAATDRRIVEPMRGISAALLASTSQAGTHSRLVTSPAPGSGKSTLSMNLARTLAASGRRVLVIDADNDGQGITRRLKLRLAPGLADLFEGRVDASKIIRDGELPTLKIVPAGKNNVRFGDMLSSRSGQEAFRSLFQGFDEVVVDSPPVLAKSDTMVLATLVDEVVLVLRAGQTTRAEATGAQQQLASVGANVVGVVLNAVDPKTTRRAYGYGYGYGYGYAYSGAEEETPAGSAT